MKLHLKFNPVSRRWCEHCQADTKWRYHIKLKHSRCTRCNGGYSKKKMLEFKK